MALQIERVGDVVVLVPEGMLTGGAETNELRITLHRLVDEGQRKILLDLAKTTHITSTSFGILASVHTSAARHDLHFVICNVNERIRKVWTGVFVLLKPPFELYDTRETALQALATL